MRRGTALAFAVAAACAGSPVGSLHGRPSTPPAAGTYGAERPVALTSLEAAAAEAARQAGSTAEPSPALVSAARELARAASEGDAGALGAQRVRAALTRSAAFDPAPRAQLVAGARERLPAAIGGMLPADATHVGLGGFERGDEAWLVALSSRRAARVEPFRRDVAPGARQDLAATLVGLTAARVIVTLPSGDTREVAAARGTSVRATVGFAGPGRHVVEVIGDGPRGPEVAALLTVLAGGAAAGPSRREAAPDPVDVAAAEQRVEQALNALRVAQGLSRVTFDTTLKSIARRHSEQMLAQGILAHVLPGSGDLAERLRRADVGYRLAVENVARGRTALEAHEVAEESPAHRRNMLLPQARVAGIGVARATGGGGEQVVYLTEILVAREAARSPAEVRAELRQVIGQARSAAGAPPLVPDAALDGLAQRTADEMARGSPPGERRLAAAALELEGRRRSAADALLVASPREAARSRNATDAGFRRFGTGIATGSRTGLLHIAIAYTD